MSARHDAKWFFVEEDPNDRVRSTTRRHSLEGSGLNTVDRVVREAIQNSVDATLPNLKTEVVLQNLKLSGERASEFRDMLQLDFEDSPMGRLEKLGLKSGNTFQRLRDKRVPDLEVTLIEDSNTCGLGYDATDDKDRSPTVTRSWCTAYSSLVRKQTAIMRGCSAAPLSMDILGTGSGTRGVHCSATIS